MALYLTIAEGERADRAVPLLATRDPEIIALVAGALSERLTGGTQKQPKIRELTKRRPVEAVRE